jgi:hypothetical protein
MLCVQRADSKRFCGFCALWWGIQQPNGRIGCETKLAVAERQRGSKGVALDIVPGHQRAPVDTGCCSFG